jgi:hypothetical protein
MVTQGYQDEQLEWPICAAVVNDSAEPLEEAAVNEDVSVIIPVHNSSWLAGLSSVVWHCFEGRWAGTLVGLDSGAWGWITVLK